MEWLNYHHLLYFWTVAREGGVAKAAKRLRLSHPTISGQVKALERRLGEKLFAREGRRLVLTEVGTMVYRYADEIFSLGRELLDTVKGRPSGRPPRLTVGIADAVPKLIARRLLDPAWRMKDRPYLVCLEERHDRLLAALATHSIDVVISDSPLGPGSGVKAYSHPLGECGMTFFATGKLAAGLEKGFPRSMDGAPLLVPTESAATRRALDAWLEAEGVRPRIVAEFEDSALLKVFGQDGAGIFAAPTVIEDEIAAQHGVRVVGRTDRVRQRFFAISPERRVKHPAVLAITEAARTQIFS